MQEGERWLPNRGRDYSCDFGRVERSDGPFIVSRNEQVGELGGQVRLFDADNTLNVPIKR